MVAALLMAVAVAALALLTWGPAAAGCQEFSLAPDAIFRW